MAQLAPPESPPLVALADGDGLDRLRVRLWQISLAAVTILITAWFVSLGPVSAILAVAVAKHVLVAILAMGLGIDASQPVDR